MMFLAPPNRRLFMVGSSATLLTASDVLARASLASAAEALVAIEAEVGGRVGVAAWNTADGVWLRRRADERFAMASTFKVLLAGAVLARIDRGELSGESLVRFTGADLLSYSPRTRARVEAGAMSVLDLCAAAVEFSDNTAANLLLVEVGGPAGLTAWLRETGDATTRLDRTETDLNTNLPGDRRDTTTPNAFVRTLDRLLLGNTLSPFSRRRLIDWMIACATGRARLRAGLPVDWRVGDKTGSGENGAINDVAILWPPGRRPILVAAMLSGSARSTDDLATTHARIARVVVSTFG